MDSLTWLREYKPWADETLRPNGDTLPLTNRLRECADALSSALLKLSRALEVLDGLAKRHEGYEHGAGACVCEWHQRWRLLQLPEAPKP